MIDLLTLGALDLRRRDGPELNSVLAQPKRTALLVYLALARPYGFQRRDTLLGLFWPDHDTEHARNNLRQAVHFLRRSLGAEAIISRGDEDIGMAEGVLSCDAVQFEAQLDAGELERGLSLYAGDLLPGFFVQEAPEFERWLDAERTRLRGRAVRACWSLAEEKERAGDTAHAAEWGRRAVEFAPTDDTQIMKLMQLLARAGDRSAAIAAFEAHARRLRTELEVEPSEAATALVEEIRKAQPRRPEGTEAPVLTLASVPTALPAHPTPPEFTGSEPAAAPTAPRRSRYTDNRWLRDGAALGLLFSVGAGVLVGIPVTLLAVGAGHALRPDMVPVIEARVLVAAAALTAVEAALLWLWFVRRPTAPIGARPPRRGGAGLGFALGVLVALSVTYTMTPPPPRPQGPPLGALRVDTVTRKVAVARFANLTGDPTLDPVGRLAEDWVVRHLRSIPEAQVVGVTGTTAADASPDAVTALARRTDADLVLFASYYRDGDDLLLTASLVPPRGGRISPEITGMGIGPVRAPRDRPAIAIERLASIVAGAVASGCRVPPCVPGRRAPMYEARELYLEAFDAEARGDYGVARRKYSQASRLDSTFVNAYTHLAELSGCAQRDSIGEILEARRRDFGLYDLLYMRIIRARCRNDGEAVYRFRREQLEIAPRNPDTRAGVAHAALLSGRLREAETRYRARLQEAADGPAADQLDYARLAYVLHLEGKIEDELRVAVEGRRRLPKDPRIPSLDVRGLAALGRTEQLEARVDEARRTGASVITVAWMYVTASMELEWHDHADAARQFALSALRELDRASSAERADARYVAMRAHTLLALGRWGEARRLADAGKPLDATLVTVRGLASAGAGDTSAARMALMTLDRLPDSVFDGETITRELCQASVLAALGKKDEALRRLEDGQARNTLPRSGPHIAHAISYPTVAAGGELLRHLWHDPRFERMFAERY